MADDLKPETKGAWLLAQSRSLEAWTGAARLENISHAGTVGRLYNVLRRGKPAETSTIEADTVATLTRLNGIDVASRREGLRVLQEQGRIDVASSGAVAVLGATSRTVLETTAAIFDDLKPSPDEEAVIALSEHISGRPMERSAAEKFVSDRYRISKSHSQTLVNLCKNTAIIDEETDKGRTIVFNSNLFRDGARARKAFFVIDGLGAAEKSLLSEVEELLTKRGAVFDEDVERMLGADLFRRLVGVGYFDRMEVNNAKEAVGYVALPDAFQRFGRPFEEDPIDDAKALLASLTYGMTRSGAARGNITLPIQLLNALIAGRSVGPVAAIGQDYKELERRGVVHVFPDRYAHSMTLLKRDVGELALAILKGQRAAEQAILLGGSSATGFRGPDESRQDVRRKNTVEDRSFMTGALDRIRSGG